MIRRLVMLAFTCVGIYIIISLSQSVYALWTKRGYFESLKADLEQKQAENERLKEKLKFVQTPAFVEQEARNKFSLQRPGEVVVVIPDALQSASVSTSPSPTAIPYWQEWSGLFF